MLCHAEFELAVPFHSKGLYATPGKHKITDPRGNHC